MSWQKILIPISGIPLLVLLAYGLGRDPNVIESPLPGREAFEFAGTTLDGDTLRLSDLRGSVVVLNFWASWCLACIDEHPVLVEVSERYPGDEVRVIGVVYQDTRENARRWMRERGGDWPSVMDRDSRIAIDYGVYGVPETFFIGPDGRVAYKQIGPVNRSLVASWIERLRGVDPEATGPDVDIEPSEADVPVGRSRGHERAAPGESGSTPEDRVPEGRRGR